MSTSQPITFIPQEILDLPGRFQKNDDDDGWILVNNLER